MLGDQADNKYFRIVDVQNCLSKNFYLDGHQFKCCFWLETAKFLPLIECQEKNDFIFFFLS